MKQMTWGRCVPCAVGADGCSNGLAYKDTTKGGGWVRGCCVLLCVCAWGSENLNTKIWTMLHKLRPKHSLESTLVHSSRPDDTHTHCCAPVYWGVGGTTVGPTWSWFVRSLTVPLIFTCSWSPSSTTHPVWVVPNMNELVGWNEGHVSYVYVAIRYLSM